MLESGKDMKSYSVQKLINTRMTKPQESMKVISKSVLHPVQTLATSESSRSTASQEAVSSSTSTSMSKAEVGPGSRVEITNDHRWRALWIL